MQKRTLVLGGELRQLHMAKALEEEGILTDVYGFDTEMIAPYALPCPGEPDFRKYEMILLPLPACGEEEMLYTPLFRKKIPVEQLLRRLSADQTVVGGLMSSAFYQRLTETGARVYDFCERAEFSICNAVPTAEGAVAIAMEETPFTIHGSHCLVVGNGHVGRALSCLLQCMGAKVTVSARRQEHFAEIVMRGQRAVHTGELAKEMGGMDIVFNTVPHRVIDSNALRQLKKDCPLIDLASKPGGVDLESAKELGIKVIWAQGIPGAVAPQTAGIVMKDTLMNIRRELEKGL